MFTSGAVVGTTSCLSVAILSDNFIEENERFILSVDSSQNDPASRGTESASVFVTIHDADGTPTLILYAIHFISIKPISCIKLIIYCLAFIVHLLNLTFLASRKYIYFIWLKVSTE